MRANTLPDNSEENNRRVSDSQHLFIHTALESYTLCVQNPFLMGALCMTEWNNEWLQQNFSPYLILNIYSLSSVVVCSPVPRTK